MKREPMVYHFIWFSILVCMNSNNSSHQSEWIFTLEKRSKHCRFTMRLDDWQLNSYDAKSSTMIGWFSFLFACDTIAKENHYNQTTGRMIMIIIGEPLLFLTVKNAAVISKNNRLNEWGVNSGETDHQPWIGVSSDSIWLVLSQMTFQSSAWPMKGFILG